MYNIIIKDEQEYVTLTVYFIITKKNTVEPV